MPEKLTGAALDALSGALRERDRRVLAWADVCNEGQPKRQRALALVLAGRSHAEVAALLRVRRETVWRWSRDPRWAAELSARRADRRAAVAGELDAAALDAVRVLRGLVNDVAAPPVARVRAAAELLDRAGVGMLVAGASQHEREGACGPQLADATG